MDERIVVTPQEMKRYQLLQRVLEGKLTLGAVAVALGMSYRHAKRLKGKVARGGLAALAHGNRGREPANKRSEELRRRVLELSQTRYGDFNDTHFCEQLAEREGISINRETIRRWRREAGVRPKRRRRAPQHRRRRPRREAPGMMMLWDGSPHHWFGAQQPPCCLMAAIDDATGEVLGLLFVPQESSWAYLKLLEQVVRGHGVPHSVYQDCHSALRRNDEFWTLQEELAGERDPTQVGAALKALQIEPIFALSPQAKGRVERLFGTLQDRLVALLRLEGITDPRAGNAYAQNGFIDYFNRQFAQPPEQPQSVWRKPPPAKELERLLALSYQATVGNDNAVRLGGMVIDIPPGPRGRSYARARVQLRQWLDGSWRVYYQERLIASAPATEIAELIRTKQRRKGTRTAHDAAWVFQASAPGGPQTEFIGRSLSQPSVDPELGKRKPSSLRVRQFRRTGPGRAIGGTRIA